ncbi:E3 SUMO-protein ligase RanBP2-like isoform X2 [Hyperolius riggenbachi]|uniref:E3 SUMO-protein ligase RanBP2-like isoform X2 n=1 Tax=Hyperolius riggenbachi TaxID=752182 RepID=UPI0035A37005
MRRSKAELQKYIENVQSSISSPREKSMKGFLFAKLYYEAKEYDLAKRSVSSYISVHERDPKAHRFLGHLFEIEGNIDKAIGCYKRSLELNPTQKDLVLKIAELVCTINVTDGRAEYWVERAAKFFPGNPVIYRLKEQLLNTQGEAGWNQLFDLIQSELFARPNDVYVNIRLVELFRSNKRLDEAVIHCLKPERRALRTHLEWCSCVVKVLQEYINSSSASPKSDWRTINKELLLAHADLVLVTLSTRNVQESRRALESFDQALLSLKTHADGIDDLSVTFAEMRGHYYMHAGTQLLKMAQNNEVQWKASLEPAALCYLLAFQVSWNKQNKGEENAQNLLEGLAYDRQSQSGHLLLSISLGKDDFLKDVAETFANSSGQETLLKLLFEDNLSMDKSFLGTDDISNTTCQIPDVNELHRYDHGAIRIHGGDLQHLTWLGLQWHFMSTSPNLRKWLKQLFPRLPQETSKLDSNNPESICLLDLEVFLLAVIYSSHLQLKSNSLKDRHQPQCLPMAICKQLFTDKQRSWWEAVYSLVHKTAQPGTSAKLRLVIQHDLNTLRALEKHGLQPAILIQWARSLFTTGDSLNSFYDQKDYMVRCIHYWKKVLPQLDLIKQRKSIPEPVDPLFKHFHSKDVKVSELRDLEDEAGISFAKMDILDGKFDDAILALEAIKSVESYWNLALVYQRRGEEIENDGMPTEELEEYQNHMQKCKSYLLKIIDDVSADPSLMAKLSVPIETVEEMLEEVRRNLDEGPENHSPQFRDTQSFIATSGIKHSTPSPTKFCKTPKSLTKTPPRWAEDQKTLIEELVQQVEALKKEVHELRMNNSNANMSSQRWPAEGFPPDAAAEGYHLTQGYYDVPLTVSTTAHPSYYVQSPVYNPQQLLRPVANVTPTKTAVYPVNRMATQQHMYAMHTPPVQNTAMCGSSLRFESPATNILSPQTDEYYNYGLTQNTANPALPEPGYFTKPTPGAQTTKSDFGKNSFAQPMPSDGSKSFAASLQSTPASTFKFNSNFKSNDGDFTFTSNQGVAQPSIGSECLLRLLTSDKPIADQGIKSTGFEPNADARNMFRFGEKSFLNNITEGINSGQDRSGTSFAQSDSVFGFQGSAKSTFVPPTFVPQSRDHNQSHESDAGSEYVAEEEGPHFEPVVPLPEKIEVKTGEEDEEEMFCNRAKLFRFDTDTKEWKERGIGNVKILRHCVSGKIRLLMRREQVLKICANHLITTDMKLKPLSSSDRSYVWYAHDYADEKPKPEQLAIRFKTSEEAALFKAKFEEAQKLLLAQDTNSEADKVSEKAEAKIPHSFSLTQDAKTIKTGSSSLGLSASAFTFNVDTLTGKSSAAGQLVKGKEQWVCRKCSAMNEPAKKQCVHCHALRTNSTTISGSASPTTVTGFKNITVSQPTALGTDFIKKQGQWDCDVCLIRNEPSATKCIACQAPKTSESVQTTASSASSFKFVSAGDCAQKDLGSVFGKKEGQWDCTTCLVRNQANATKCVACNSPKSSPSTGPPAQTPGVLQSKPGNESLASMFSRKEGQWDCGVCLIRNKAAAATCAACLAANPAATGDKTDLKPDLKPAQNSGFLQRKPESESLASMFSRKKGEWDCTVCLVRNEASAATCAACLTANPTATGDKASSVLKPDLKPAQNSDFLQRKPESESLASMFSRKEGQWDCTVCLVRNEASAVTCVACLTANPAATADKVTTDLKPDLKPDPKQGFTFGFKAGTSESSGPPPTGFKCNFSGKDVKFGTTDETPAFSFKTPTTSGETKSSKDGFSFTMPFSATSFKFGTAEPSKAEQGKEATPLTKPASEESMGASSETKLKSEESKQNESGEVFANTANSFSFADLANSSEGFAFGRKDPDFKGFSGAGEKLFVSKSDQIDKTNTPAEQECGEDLYRTEDRDDIHFEPVVQLPDKVDLVTGEEEEKMLYSQRVKLYRFDAETGQWKERGVGMLKILKNEVNGKLRILMRREQVLKVCANHWITTTMNLKPLSGSDRAWMWMANDFSDGDARLEQLAAKFKTPEQGEDFKYKFEECQRLLLDIPLQTPHKLVDTGRTAHLIKKAEEMKSGLKDLKTFLTDHSKTAEEDTNQSTIESLIKKSSDCSDPTYEWDTYDMRAGSLEGNLDDSVYASPLASSPDRNLFRFGESTVGFNFSFQPASSPAKSPTKLNQSRVSVGTDEESDVTQEEERDGQYFEPVVPLPDLVEVTSGEENEQTLFCHRAKLYRFDKTTNQWKERGIGDLKILQNYESKAARIVMRRDQVLKLCANHRITKDKHLEPMKGAERAWVWTALDYAEGEEKVELFAVRFKLQEVADLFKEIFEEAKFSQSKDILLTPFSARVITPKASPCGKAAVAILEETTKEKTELPVLTTTSPEKSDLASSTEKTPKNVVSPPKFVFGSEVVKNIFGTEKKAFTFGNSSGAGTLFGFSFNASNTSDMEEKHPLKAEPEDQDSKCTGSTKDTPSVLQKPSHQVLQSPSVTSSTSSTQPLQMPSRAKSSTSLEADGSPDDVVLVYEMIPSEEQKALAEELLLPPTFFCYKNKPGYVSDETDVDDEDFETAVRNLKGQLYREDRSKAQARHGRELAVDKECEIVWETTPTPKEKEKAENLKLPPTFFCGVSSDTDDDKENAEDYESAIRKVKQSEESSKTEGEDPQMPSTTSTKPKPQDTTNGSTQEPVDLSSKTEPAKAGTDTKEINFSFADSGLSFADLASDNGEFSFGSKDTNFQWANTGAAVFSSVASSRKAEHTGESDEDVVHSDDVHFEPIVSLPEVEIKSGEEEEEVLFKERAKLYRWDRELNQWKERGVGDIKILYHQEKKYYRILMRREQVLKVCANHVITKEIKLAPLNTTNNAFVWTCNDYTDGEAKIEQLAARFKNQELADSFQKKFEECQNNLQ